MDPTETPLNRQLASSMNCPIMCCIFPAMGFMRTLALSDKIACNFCNEILKWCGSTRVSDPKFCKHMSLMVHFPADVTFLPKNGCL